MTFRSKFRTPLVAAVVALLSGAAGLHAAGQSQAPPVPRPFPQPGQVPPATSVTPKSPKADSPPPVAANPPASAATSTVAAGPSQPGRPSDADLGYAPVYPAADYLDAFDAGHGQHYFLFGTNAAYADIVSYYKRVMKDSGREVFRTPAMQEFDLPGKFRDDAVAFPPSVVVKDYAWNGSEGYLFVDGTKEKRYKTIIQIVPPPK